MTGFVYHDGRGTICGVSLRSDPDLERFERIEIEDDVAVGFMAGTVDVAQWTVVHGVLMPIVKASRNHFSGLVKVPDLGPGDDPCLIAEITEQFVVSLRGGGGPRFDRNLPVLIFAVCEPNNPDALVEKCCVPVDDLLKGNVEFKMPPHRRRAILVGDLDVYTTPLFVNTFLSR